jgi:hypothetical protein
MFSNNVYVDNYSDDNDSVTKEPSNDKLIK